MGRLGLGPRVLGQLGSRVSVSASFQIFALIAGGMFLVGREIVRRGNVMSQGGISGEMSYTQIYARWQHRSCNGAQGEICCA